MTSKSNVLSMLSDYHFNHSSRWAISHFLSKQAPMPNIPSFFSAYDFASYFSEKMETTRRWLPKTPTAISTHLSTATTVYSCLPSCIHRWFTYSAPLTCTLHLTLSCTLKDIIPVISPFSLLYSQVFILINFHFTLFFFSWHTPLPTLFLLGVKLLKDFCIYSFWFLAFHSFSGVCLNYSMKNNFC